MNQPDERSGILAGGNFVVDSVQVIDSWPDEEGLAIIESQSFSNGGGPYNLLVDLSRLGATYPLAATGRIGDDEFGDWIQKNCRQHGIDTEGLKKTAQVPTSYTHVMTSRKTGRRTFFHNKGANSYLMPEDFDFSGRREKFFYLGYLLLLDRLDQYGPEGKPAALEVLKRARRAGLMTVLDCVSEKQNRFHSIVHPVLPEVDILLANDFEAECLTGRSFGRGNKLDRQCVKEAATRLLESGVNHAVVIHAPEGAFLATRDAEAFWQPSLALPPDAIAGSAGAGDALAAGFLHGLHQGFSASEAIRLGVCVAAASLRKPTCSEGIASADECLRLQSKYGFLEER